MVIGDNRVKRSKKCAELGLKFLPDMVYLTQEALEIAGDTAPNRSRHETRGGKNEVHAQTAVESASGAHHAAWHVPDGGLGG